MNLVLVDMDSNLHIHTQYQIRGMQFLYFLQETYRGTATYLLGAYLLVIWPSGSHLIKFSRSIFKSLYHYEDLVTIKNTENREHSTSYAWSHK